MCQKARVFVATSAPRMSDVTTDELGVTESSRLRATGSATAPPKSDKPMIGTARTRPFMPRRSGEDVSWYSSQLVAVSSTHVPDSETSWPIQYSAKSRCRSGARPGSARTRVLAVAQLADVAVHALGLVPLARDDADRAVALEDRRVHVPQVVDPVLAGGHLDVLEADVLALARLVHQLAVLEQQRGLAREEILEDRQADADAVEEAVHRDERGFGH